MTLLQGVQVLAIGDRTVVSGQEHADEPALGTGAAKIAHRIITLMVDPNQAEALQLATKYGTVSLALRNPLDANPAGSDTTLLSELSDEFSGMLAQLAVPQTPTVAPAEQAEENGAAGRAEDEPAWQTIVIRGGAVEIKSFARAER